MSITLWRYCVRWLVTFLSIGISMCISLVLPSTLLFLCLLRPFFLSGSFLFLALCFPYLHLCEHVLLLASVPNLLILHPGWDLKLVTCWSKFLKRCIHPVTPSRAVDIFLGRVSIVEVRLSIFSQRVLFILVSSSMFFQIWKSLRLRVESCQYTSQSNSEFYVEMK